MRTTRTAVALVVTATIAVVIGACSDDTTVDPSVLRGEIRIQVYFPAKDGYESLAARADAAQGLEGEVTFHGSERVRNAFALITAMEGEELPETPVSGVSLALNGRVGRHFVTDGADPAGVWLADCHPAPEVPAAGEPLEVTLQLPGADPIVRSIPMVQPADFTAPTAGTELRLGEDVDLRWSAATVEETDYVIVSFPGYGASTATGSWIAHGSPAASEALVHAAAGEAGVRYPASALAAAYDELVHSWEVEDTDIVPGDAVHADLNLMRTREVSNEPELAAGTTHLLVEVARVRVVLRP